jgi:Zn-dependent oligopeptidase
MLVARASPSIQKVRNMMNFIPAHLNMGLSVNEINQKVDHIVSEHASKIQTILQTEDSERNFKNTFHALGLADSWAAAHSCTVVLPSLTSQEKDVRTASLAAKKKISELWNDCYFNESLYKVLADAQRRILEDNQQKSELSEEQLRLIEKVIHLFKKNGMHLSVEKRNEISQLNSQITSLAETFCANIGEDMTTVKFTLEELKGLEKEVIDGFKKENDDIIVSCKPSELMTIYEGADNEKTREKMRFVANNRLKENIPMLKEIYEKRNQKATLLGYENHAEFMITEKMAKNLKTAQAFLQQVSDTLDSALDVDLNQLLTVKKELQGESETKLNSWDIPYLTAKAKKRLDIDEKEIQKYFPTDHVTTQILAIYSEVLDLKFEKVDDALVWHNTVSCYSVSNKETNEKYGYFYLDLFSRDGKYAHQCVFPIVPSFRTEENVKINPSCVILGNLTKATNERPSLLKFREVETFFYEFGHVMHCVLSQSSYSLFSWHWPIVPWGGILEQDFLEVPSMMFQLWVFNEQVLARLSNHYLNNTQLPKEIIDKIVTHQHFQESVGFKRLIAMSMYDLKMHSQQPPYEYKGNQGLDQIQCFNLMMKDISKIEQQENTFMCSTWYHPCMGYDAGYYGYLWSEVYAYDLFSLFKKGCFDSNVGKKLRDQLLTQASMKNGLQLLEDVLGRKPETTSFFHEISKHHNKM